MQKLTPITAAAIILPPHSITALDTLNTFQGATSNPRERSQTGSVFIADEALSRGKKESALDVMHPF